MPLITKHTLPGRRYWHSPFHAEMAPSIWARARGCYANPLSLGLLQTRPDADGLGGEELQDDVYHRLPVDLHPHTPALLVVPNKVSFALSPGSLVVGLAAWNSDGQIEAYGALLSQTDSSMPPSSIELPSHRVVVRRLSVKQPICS